MRYGLSYQGSKNDIAQWVIDHLPPADVLIDAFAGGCAITHCAMLSHKFKRIIANDIDDIPSLFIDAINGKYRDETRWISREDFFALKDTDPYVATSWSFKNDRKTYLYSKEIEPYKRAFHFAVVFKDFTPFESIGIDVPQGVRDLFSKCSNASGRRLIMRRWILANIDKIRAVFGKVDDDNHIGELQSLERLQRLQSLERLQRLQSLGSKVSTRQGDYTTIPLPTSETYTIYCDPPYNGTSCGAYSGFDHERFYTWLRSLSVPVVISEYSMPTDFVLIDECTKLIKSDGKGQHKGAERLFCHESTIDKLPKTTLF